MRHHAITAAALLATPALAAASTGGATGVVILLGVLVLPVALTAAGITWHFLPDGLKAGSLPVRLRRWGWMLCVYDLLLVVALGRACGLT